MDTATISRKTAFESLLALRMLRERYEILQGRGGEKAYWEKCVAQTDEAIAEIEKAVA